MRGDSEQPSDKRAAYYRTVGEYGSRFDGFDAANVQMMLNLFYTHDVLETHISRVLSSHNLSVSAFNVLAILVRHGTQGCPLHELGDLLLTSRANVTGLVDCLVSRKLVERTANSRDRRVRIARITRAGEKLLESLLPQHYSNINSLCEAMNEKEKAALTDLLVRLRLSAQS